MKKEKIDSKLWLKRYGTVRKEIFDYLQSRTTDNLPPDVREACLLSFRRGKCIRGIMFFMTYMMSDYSSRPLRMKIHNAVVGGAIPESYHVASLIHDDIVDRSELRRGDPAVWYKYDPSIAALAGDIFMFTGVMDDFLHVPPPECLPAITKELRLAGMTMSTGEMKDALETSYSNSNSKSKKRSGVEEYYKIIGKKTLPLMVASVTAPAMANKVTKMQMSWLRRYVIHVGYAFQIRDDVIDIVGSEKAAMKDLRKNVDIGSNYVLSLYQDEFGDLNEEDISLLKKGQLSNNLLLCVQKTQKIVNTHIKTAIKYLEIFEPDKYRRGLKDAAIFCGTRER